MLKMLQQPALEAWNHSSAEGFRQSIDYSTAFIATDLSWGAQIEALGEGKLDPETHRRVGIAAFTTHVLRGLINGFRHRLGQSDNDAEHPFRRATLTADQEGAIVKELSETWHLKPSIASFSALRRSLGQRLVHIREFASREAALGESGRSQRVADNAALHLHFLQAAAFGVEVFNDAVGEQDGKWALLFDELEIAPGWIREELIRSLRGTDDKLLLKLALSPYSFEAQLMEPALGAVVGNDYDQISLWYAEKQEGYAFCEHLWYGMLAERGLPPLAPKDVLGQSYFETTQDEWAVTGTAYGPAGRLGKLFVKMAQKDRTFRAHLHDKGIDPRALHKIDPGERAAEVRKIAPLLAVRDYYRSWGDESGSGEDYKRSRKQATIYAGASSLFAISEGNPRWFIGIVEVLLDWMGKDKSTIPGTVQADELRKAAQRFSALLRTIPLPAELRTGKSERWLLTILNTIGEYFHRRVVVDDFVPEPPGSIIVDTHTPPAVLQLLAQAVNSGALVYLPDSESQVLLSSLRGKTFRLSYLLAPIQRTPLRRGIAVSLSPILKTSSKGTQQQLLLEDE